MVHIPLFKVFYKLIKVIILFYDMLIHWLLKFFILKGNRQEFQFNQ